MNRDLRRAALLVLLAIPLGLAATYTTATFDGKPDLMGDGRLRALVLVTGDAGEPAVWLPPVYGKDLADLQTQVKTAVAALNAGRTDAKDIPPGSTVGAPPTPTKPPDPQPPTAQQQFQIDLSRWYRIQQAITAGILTGTEPEVVAFKAQVKSEYQPSYLPAF